MIDNILQDIVLAKDNHAYLSALSLALTLPNVLSNVEYGKETYKDEYIEWFNKWVSQYYSQPKSDNELINKGIEATKFDGINCYLLRCALLHSGNTDLKDKKGCRKIDSFELCISNISPHCGDSYLCNVTNNVATDVCVTLNVIGLIDALVAGAKEYILKNKDKIMRCEKNDESDKIFGGIEIKKV